VSFDAAIAALEQAGALDNAPKKYRGKGHYSPEYKLYLKSPEWESKRQQVLSRDGHQCRGCGRTKGLQVHHLRYDNLGHEPLLDLTVLCADCHKAVHKVISSRCRRKK
jgi:5-methylcytosine-specific restriction endonuclease McrA